MEIHKSVFSVENVYLNKHVIQPGAMWLNCMFI